MKVVRCFSCGAVYPSDMDKCPTCGCDNNGDNSKKMEIPPKAPNLRGYWNSASTSQNIAVSDVPKVTCPYCNSNNCSRISNTDKIINIALFGVFGNKRKHQWHCNNCRSNFG